MAARVKCPHCGKVNNVSDELVGRAIPCAGCGQSLAGGRAASGAPASPLAASPASRTLSGSWSNKKKSSPLANPLVIGAASLTAILLIVALILLLNRGDSDVDVAAVPPVQNGAPANGPSALPTEAAPRPQTIQMMPLTPVALKQGSSAVLEIQIARNGAQGPIEIKVDGLPDKVTAVPLTIPAEGFSGKLELVAAADAPTDSLNKRLTVKAQVADRSTELTTPISIERVVPPTILPIAAASVKPGGKTVIQVRLERNSLQGPIELQLEGLPEKVTAAPAVIAADQSAGQIELTAAGDSKEGAKDVQVALVAGSTKIAAPLKLHVERFPFRLTILPVPTVKPMVLHIKPGEKQNVEVAVERRSYQGPVQLALEGLPPGVSAPVLTVPEGASKATLELAAAADAREMIRTVTATTQGPGVLNKEQLLLRVLTGDEIDLDFIGAEGLERLFRRGSFGGRLQASSKEALVQLYGGSAESEEAVLRGLKWLAIHQHEQGYWSLENYDKAGMGCTCKTDAEAEVKEADTAGTALGLLPFLAAGVTHMSAPEQPSELAGYQTNVKRGIEFIARYQKHTKDINDGQLATNMYAHALATMALCEAYAMTNDEDVRAPAQKALKYLIAAQHGGGGWRYSPRTAGDTSVVAWVVLALRSGQLAGLSVDYGALQRARLFMNSVSAGPEGSKQSRYSYQPDGKETVALTAAGLLTRQYLGWDKDQEGLVDGSAYLMQNLPPPTATSVGRIYYYYYATQVLHHLEGENWDKWNYHMREHLLRTQAKAGHEEGSWTPVGTDWGSKGGRLYSTSLSLLTLEAYYRHLPLYRKFSKPGARQAAEAAKVD